MFLKGNMIGKQWVLVLVIFFPTDTNQKAVILSWNVSRT